VKRLCPAGNGLGGKRTAEAGATLKLSVKRIATTAENDARVVIFIRRSNAFQQTGDALKTMKRAQSSV
jgi:hypothetical protein